MRNISIIVAVLAIIAMIMAGNAEAGETNDTNTKIEINFSEKIEQFKNFIYSESVETAEASSENVEAQPEIQPEPEVVVEKTPEEIKYEATLNKWKAKQANLWNNLPKEKFIINASAYTAAADECGKSDGITASGIKVQENRTIACPPNFPFGAKIAIDGMGTYVCEDRGGAIKGNHIDIYMETKAEAFKFGRRNLNAEVVL